MSTAACRRTGDTPLPVGTRLIPDRSLRRFQRDRLLLGGSPTRLLRVSATAAAHVRRWLDGIPVGDDPAAARLARTLLDSGMAHPNPAAATPTPADVTVVVPVKDDPAGVRRLCESVRETTRGLPATVVVDDGSEPPLPHATHRHGRARGPAAARNAGWRRATTPLVAFIDADAVPEPGWLDALLPHFADPTVAAAAPRVTSHHAASRPSAVARYEAQRSCLDMGPEPARVRPGSRLGYVPSTALLVRRDALEAVGGFAEDLRFGEDVDLVWRLIDEGNTVRYAPEATVRHDPRTTLRAWLRQRYDYGTSAAALSTRHGDRPACARLSPVAAVPWLAVAAGKPAVAALAAALGAVPFHRWLARRGVPGTTTSSLALRGNLATGRMLADAIRRGWWPLALLTRTGRRVLLAALLPRLIDTIAGRNGPRWFALRLADDLSYSLGVWAGCLRHRTIAPLLPHITATGRDTAGSANP